MSRVVWTNEEKAAVSRRMMQIFQDDPHSGNMQALQMAQQCLPYDRRLTISHGRVHSHKARIEEARRMAYAARELAAKQVSQESAATGVPPPSSERKETPTERLSAVLDLLVDAIADRVALRIADRLAAQVGTTATVRHDPLPLAEARCTGKPGVVILGLLPVQASIVQESHGDRLDITCLTPDQARARPPVQRAWTILMTKFIAHDIQDRYRKAPSLRWCNGAVTELQQMLDKIIAGVL